MRHQGDSLPFWWRMEYGMMVHEVKVTFDRKDMTEIEDLNNN